MGKGPEETLLQGVHKDGPQTNEKMRNINNHQRDVNKNHNEVSLHNSQNG